MTPTTSANQSQPITPSELATAITACLDANQSACVWGSPGIGKSQIVHQVGRSKNLPVQEIRAVLLDPVDLRGLPHVNANNQAQWAVPSFLPQSGAGILFLDELNRAPMLVQNACFQLVLDRKIGEYTLPADWRIMAACNRESDGGGVTKMNSALCNRFVHLELEPNLEDWCKWAIKSGIEPAVIAFLRFRPNLLHAFDRDSRAFPTPRSWEFISRMVAQQPTNSIQHALFSGAVGSGAAAEFSAFLRLYQSIPSIDGLLMNPSTANVPSDPAALYAIASALARRSNCANITRVIQYLDRMPQEYAVLAIKDATGRDQTLCVTSDFTKWAVAHSDVVF